MEWILIWGLELWLGAHIEWILNVLIWSKFLEQGSQPLQEESGAEEGAMLMGQVKMQNFLMTSSMWFMLEAAAHFWP